MGHEPSLYTKREDALLIDHISGYDYRHNNSHSEYHRYIIFYFLTYETGNKKLANEFFTVTDYDVEKPILSKSMANIIDLCIMFVSLSIFSLLCFKIIRNFSNIENKYILYLFILNIITIISLISIVYYFYDFIDIDNLGYVNYLNFGYGFYIACLSTTLFFIAYTMQNKLIENKN